MTKKIRWSLVLSVTAIAACGAPARARREVPTATSPAPSHPVSASVAPSVRDTGCDPSRVALEGFTPDDRPLSEARGETTAVPMMLWHEGVLAFSLPTAWFPSRRHERDEVLYDVLTGDPDDAFAIYYGSQPGVRPHDEGAFRLALGGVMVRGSVVVDATGLRRVEAIAALPCEAHAFVSVWAHTRSPERFAAILDSLASLRHARTEPSVLQETAVDGTNDAAAVRALVQGDALGRELVDRALASGTMHARYPLAMQHPLADQLLSGRFQVPIGGAPAEVAVWLPVRAGHVGVPEPYRGLHDVTLTRAVAELAAAGCTATVLQLGHDGIAVRCADGHDVRVLAETDGAELWPDSIRTAARLRSALAGWSAHGDRVGNWPITLCGDDPWIIERAGSMDFARTDRCAIALDSHTGRIDEAGFAGSCASVPVQTWSESLRRAVRLDEIRGAGTGACTFTLGWNGRSSWALAAGDGGTTSAPIASGPVLAVDRRAVHTAVAFLADLDRYASGRADELPPNVRPSVLIGLGMLTAGDSAGRRMSRLLRATAIGGPGLAVLQARPTDPEHTVVEFLGLTVELTDTANGWLVTSVRPTFNPTPAGSR